MKLSNRTRASHNGGSFPMHIASLSRCVRASSWLRRLQQVRSYSQTALFFVITFFCSRRREFFGAFSDLARVNQEVTKKLGPAGAWPNPVVGRTRREVFRIAESALSCAWRP